MTGRTQLKRDERLGKVERKAPEQIRFVLRVVVARLRI